MQSFPAVKWPALAAIAAVLMLAVLPSLITIIYTIQLTAVLIAVLFAVSLNMVMGYGGMISFGHAAYFALGGYASALLYKHELAPLYVAMPAGAVVAFAAALLFGFFCTRTDGTYFLMLTLAVAQLVHAVIYQWYTFTGGDDGVSVFLDQGPLSSPRNYYYFALIVVTLCLGLIYAVLHSPFGYTLQAIRDNAPRAAALGIPVKRYQVLAFAIAGLFAGIAGSLFAFFNGQVSPQIAYWTQSAQPFMSVIIGGASQFAGPIVGATIYTLLSQQLARVTEHSMLYVGIVTLGIGLFFPHGIIGTLMRRKKGVAK